MTKVYLDSEAYENFREEKTHGDGIFPFNIYLCAIPDELPEVLPHWHDEMEIVYIKKGRGTVTVDFRAYTVSAPAIVLILPGQLHAIKQHQKERLEYENIIFHPRLFYSRNGELFDHTFLDPVFSGQVQTSVCLTADSPNFRVLTAPLDACDAMAGKAAENYPLFVKGQLFLELFYLKTLYPLRASDPGRRPSLDEIKPVLRYIEQRYPEKIMVSDAAHFVGFSEAHFMRFFKETMGESFVTYLNAYRLSRAEVLLKTTDKSVSEIAMETGFQNFSYFIRVFKKKYEMTPLKYRERYGSAL